MNFTPQEGGVLSKGAFNEPVHYLVMGYRKRRGYPVHTPLHNYHTIPPKVLKSIVRHSQQSWLAAQEMWRR